MNAILEIEKEQGNYAKTIASKLKASINRKMGVIDILGITIFAKYLKNHGIKPNLANSLHKFPFALEEYKITDVNYNGHRIYVVTVFKENYIRIPKMHFKLGIEPDFYVITEVDKSIERGVVGGFIKASDVKRAISDDRYYYPQKSDVSNISDLIKQIRVHTPPRPTVGRHLEASSLFVKLTDSELKAEEKNKLIRHLLTCENCAAKLKEVLQFDRVLRPRANNADKVSKPQAKRKPVKNAFTKPPIHPAEIQLSRIQHAQQQIVEDFNQNQTTPTKTETIDFIFKGKNVFDVDFGKINIKNLQGKKNLFIIITAICAMLTLGIIGAIVVKKSSHMLKPIGDIESLSADEIDNEKDFYDRLDYYDSQGAVNLDYSLTNSAGSKPGVMSVKNISWEVDKGIADKENYTKFLQVVGKNIKLNLQNELLVTSDFARNNIIRADIKFSGSGKVASLRLTQGSGSTQIDEIIQKCVYETFSYINSPAAGFIGKNLDVTLVIEL